MKKTLKFYNDDKGGTPETPDRREKVKNLLSISMRTIIPPFSRRTMCLPIRARSISRAVPH